jgi:hypothetical protein
MSRRPDVERYRENWQDEVDSASEYRAMAASETDPRLAPGAVATLPDAINNRSDIVGRAIFDDGSVLAFHLQAGRFRTPRYPGAARTVARASTTGVTSSARS